MHKLVLQCIVYKYYITIQMKLYKIILYNCTDVICSWLAMQVCGGLCSSLHACHCSVKMSLGTSPYIIS